MTSNLSPQGQELMGIITLILSFFVLLICLFSILYKVSLLSGSRGMKNIFMFLMSRLLRLPFHPIRDNGALDEEQGMKEELMKEIRKEVIIAAGVLLYLIIGLILLVVF
ncbi:hypothetical protein LC040_02870 [Bacillus tianshenii]|nr:hypothetical protein LC040_02870 [Bacillus tianshenii]